MEHGPAGEGGLAGSLQAVEGVLDGAAEELALCPLDAQELHALEEEGPSLGVEHFEAAVDLQGVHVCIRRGEVGPVRAFEGQGGGGIAQVHAQPGLASAGGTGIGCQRLGAIEGGEGDEQEGRARLVHGGARYLRQLTDVALYVPAHPRPGDAVAPFSGDDAEDAQAPVARHAAQAAVGDAHLHHIASRREHARRIPQEVVGGVLARAVRGDLVDLPSQGRHEEADDALALAGGIQIHAHEIKVAGVVVTHVAGRVDLRGLGIDRLDGHVKSIGPPADMDCRGPAVLPLVIGRDHAELGDREGAAPGGEVRIPGHGGCPRQPRDGQVGRVGRLGGQDGQAKQSQDGKAHERSPGGSTACLREPSQGRLGPSWFFSPASVISMI